MPRAPRQPDRPGHWPFVGPGLAYPAGRFQARSVAVSHAAGLSVHPGLPWGAAHTPGPTRHRPAGAAP
eukprot:4171490-Pleurochrysis_carterae.AAC.1